MAAPTLLSHAFNPASLTLSTLWSAAVVAGSAYAQGAIDLTDIAGRRYENTAAAPTGLATDTLVFQMAASAVAAETAGTIDFIASTVANDSDAVGNVAIADAVLYTALAHAAPFTYYDVLNVTNYIALASQGVLDLTPDLVANDINTAAAAFFNYLTKAPRTEDRAYALITQMNKFNQSTKAPDDLQRLQAAVEELRASLNPSGTFQMLANGT